MGIMTNKTGITDADRYNYDAIYTYNCPWSWIIGGRGIGKTWGAKHRVIRDFIKRGRQFIYLRRYDTELKEKGSFFSDIGDRFPDYTFRVNGNQAECLYLKDDTASWQCMGYFIALNIAGAKKSVPYPKVYNIIFDEVFPDNLTFLRNEVMMLEEFYNTVDRFTDRVRMFLLSNAVIQANPYFAAFHIDLTNQQKNKREFQTYCGGFVCIDLADCRGFSAKVTQTRFGRFLLDYDPQYADYAIGNKFRDNSDTMLSPVTKDDGYSYTLDTEDYGKFGVWFKLESDFQGPVISRRVRKTSLYQYTLDYRHVSEHVVYVKRADDVIQKLTSNYRRGNIRFDNPQVKSDFSMVIGELLGK